MWSDSDEDIAPRLLTMVTEGCALALLLGMLAMWLVVLGGGQV